MCASRATHTTTTTTTIHQARMIESICASVSLAPLPVAVADWLDSVRPSVALLGRAALDDHQQSFDVSGRTDRLVHLSAATGRESNLAPSVTPNDRRDDSSIVRVPHELGLPRWVGGCVPFLNGLDLGREMLARGLAIRAARLDVHDDAHNASNAG